MRAGFFTDAYDLFVIALVKPMFAIVYYAQYNGKLPLSIDLWITAIALGGTLFGQVGATPSRTHVTAPTHVMHV